MQPSKIINPKNKLFKWGPVDARPIYAFYWPRGFNNFTKKFFPGWATFILYFQENKMLAIADFKELYDNGEVIFKKFILNDKSFVKNFKEWNLVIKKFLIFRDTIDERLKNIDKKELANTVTEWNELFGGNFWNIGSLPETASWGGEQILSRELKKVVKNDQDFHYSLERLSAPEELSFYQQEELDLFALKKITNHQRFLEKLKEHQQKYFWLSNSYYRTKILNIKYFEKILNSFSAVQINKKVKKINQLKQEAIAHKQEVVKKFKLSKEILKISKRLSFCIWWQDLRKSYIWQANYIIDLLLKEVSKQFKVELPDLHYYYVDELEDLVKHNIVISSKKINSRKYSWLSLLNSQKQEMTDIVGGEAERKIKPYLAEKVDNQIKEFAGTVVSLGKVRGRVKVVFGVNNLGKVKKGDILVTAMTTPDYIVGLRKAVAVITDEGGMTCHAAIVSRELQIPCIVNTRIATKILKDGDLVEVDADKGIVRILS